MLDDLLYTWTPPFEKERKVGKLIQFIAAHGEIYGMMLNQQGQIEKVRYNFLNAMASVTPEPRISS